jgi:hypothetical protein
MTLAAHRYSSKIHLMSDCLNFSIEAQDWTFLQEATHHFLQVKPFYLLIKLCVLMPPGEKQLRKVGNRRLCHKRCSNSCRPRVGW